MQSSQDDMEEIDSEISEDPDESKNFSTDLYAMSSILAELVFGDLESISFKSFKKKTLDEFDKLRNMLETQTLHSVQKNTNPNPELYTRTRFIANFSKIDSNDIPIDNVIQPK